jgi:hypothetical protein
MFPPLPPVATAMPQTLQLVFTLAMIIPMVLVTGYVIHYWRRTGDPIPALCILGGALTTLIEPLVDVLGLCWYPVDGQWVLLKTFGRSTPVLCLFGYMWFMGGMTAWTYIKLKRDASLRTTITWFAIFIAVNAVVEIPGVHTRVYWYYGVQPLKIFGWPLWWGFVNVGLSVVAAAVLIRLAPHLKAFRIAAVVLIVPIVDAGFNAGAGWPVYTALNSTSNGIIAQLAGTATCALTLVIIWLTSLLPAAPAPSKPAELPLAAEHPRT